MTAGLHSRDFGQRAGALLPRRRALFFRALACAALTAAFFVWLYDFSAFSSGIGAARAALPLFLPAFAVLYALWCLYCCGKRVEFYQRGVVYHTPFFELDAPCAAIKEISLSQDCGRPPVQGRGDFSAASRLRPVDLLTVTLEDGRRWVFYGNVYAGLTEGAELLRGLAARAQSEAART